MKQNQLALDICVKYHAQQESYMRTTAIRQAVDDWWVIWQAMWILDKQQRRSVPLYGRERLGMAMTEKITVMECQQQDLPAVQVLGDQNRQTLGFMPRKVFEEAQKDRMLLTAKVGENLAGYLLYRISRKDAVIIHLCTDSAYRKRSVADRLIEALVGRCKAYNGIRLKCKDDYVHAVKVWERNDFVPIKRTVGRGKDEAPMTVWRRELQPVNLFNLLAALQNRTKLFAAMDTNVLLDLHSSGDTESAILLSDWLSEDLELCVTGEVFVDIARQEDVDVRNSAISFAGTFQNPPEDDHDRQLAKEALRDLFPRADTDPQCGSDYRHVCRAFAANILYLITRDEGLLQKRDDVIERLEVSIVSPTEMALQIDELKRRETYRPKSLSCSRYTFRRVTAEDFVSVAKVFLNYGDGERRQSFMNTLRECSTDPCSAGCSLIISPEGEYIALAGILPDQVQSSERAVAVLRVAKGRDAATYACKLVEHLRHSSAKDGIRCLRVVDQHLGQHMENALHDAGFLQVADYWFKVFLYGLRDPSEHVPLLELALDEADVDPEAAAEWTSMLEHPDALASNIEVAQHENYLWPGMLDVESMPCYVVPIQPQWAAELFDTAIAEYSLFGRSDELAMNTQAVYYSARPNGKIRFPARLVWYVSAGGHGCSGGKYVRAISCLRSVDIDVPKTLYRKYDHYGIYQWNDLYAMVKQDLSKKIMALVFDNTILLSSPIRYDVFRRKLKDAGVSPVLMTVTEIPPKAFSKILEGQF